MFLESLQFSISVTLPTILLMLFGIFLRYRKFIDDSFCQNASKVVFNFTLPPMIFFNMLKSPLDFSSQINLIATGVGGTLLIYFWAEWWAAHHIENRRYRCIFTQGTFRANAAILGIALILNAYGDKALAAASVYISCLVITFNVLAVITLTSSLSERKVNVGRLIISIFKNPLILAVVVGIIFNVFELSNLIPKPIESAGNLIAGLTLPLALICTGASLNFKQLKQFNQGAESTINKIVLFSASVRLIFAPLFLLLFGKLILALPPMELGIVFVTASAPVASATYAMTRNYGGDGEAAANLIAVTTLGSMLSASLGLFVLRQMGWV
ncbi:malonate transporter [Mannheimia granulomatis]|uniref:Malonate transporter n=1 Tax=Mannheimia granulomatis TaxID=85402 RepID=A0A011LWL6_9PAST|nr:AEC family transporter [Mannheimia granulomatis]EXI61588.1 malonate transporter [Mannheimia granulomatis]RGE48304.1 malonate transporter [Mannheimia granulomatis]